MLFVSQFYSRTSLLSISAHLNSVARCALAAATSHRVQNLSFRVIFSCTSSQFLYKKYGKIKLWHCGLGVTGGVM